MAAKALTDFERYGLVERQLRTRDRSWLLTIDFEAFDPDSVDEWITAMRYWASHSAQGKWRFSIFLAIEDVVRLRVTRPEKWPDFTQAAVELSQSGAVFYPHNHGVFNLETGELATVRPERVAGYQKRASFVYDVMHRHKLSIEEWLAEVVQHYNRFLAEAGIQRPGRLAFRAGGWDHGDRPDTVRAYLRALRQNSFKIDSSAASGVFGTESWRVGAPFGANVFALSDSVVEVAPCWSFNCGAKLMTRNNLGAMAELVREPRVWAKRTLPGAFVTVLHFDHLFSAEGNRSTTNHRIARFFKLISALRTASGFESATFEDLEIEW